MPIKQTMLPLMPALSTYPCSAPLAEHVYGSAQKHRTIIAHTASACDWLLAAYRPAALSNPIYSSSKVHDFVYCVDTFGKVVYRAVYKTCTYCDTPCQLEVQQPLSVLWYCTPYLLALMYFRWCSSNSWVLPAAAMCTPALQQLICLLMTSCV